MKTAIIERAQAQEIHGQCSVCRAHLQSKGFVKRRMLTLVGCVEWKRRVSRCPQHCSGSQSAPFDAVLGIDLYQHTSVELRRLGCLLAVCVPFELATWLLLQMSGIQVSEAAIWEWVQVAGQQAIENLKLQLKHLADGQQPQSESLEAMLEPMPLIITADGVTVPFRHLPKSPKGKVMWQEVKIALLARLGKHQTKAGATVSRLHQRRLVAVLGDINDLKSRVQLEALRQGVMTAAQVVWISDGACGFWRLYRECFAHCAVGILDFYHAAQHVWKAASAYQDGNPARTPQQWFTGLRHRLRHGFGKGIIKELDWLSKSKHTSEATKPILRQVRDWSKGSEAVTSRHALLESPVQ